MLITRQAPADLTSTWFNRNRVVCGGWFGAPIVNWTTACNCATLSESCTTRTDVESGSSRQVPS